MRVRLATRDDASALTAIAHRAKAVWGYDEAFLAACREGLTVSRASLACGETWVAERREGRLLGFFDLRLWGQRAEIVSLFVEPGAHKTGTGRVLWAKAEERARALGASMIAVDADPNAVGFYERMGLAHAGHVPSGTLPGRVLPRLTRAF